MNISQKPFHGGDVEGRGAIARRSKMDRRSVGKEEKR
jgi:hypothetical protein